jgi:O-antigen ligase
MKQSTLLAGLLLLMLGSFVAGLLAERFFTGASLIGPLLVLAAWLVSAAALGQQWALKAMILAFCIGPPLAKVGGSDPTMIRLGFYGALLIVGCANLVFSWRLLRTWAALCLLLYYVFAIASAAWSADRALTLGAAGGMMGLYLFALGVIARLGVGPTVRALTVSLGAGVGLSVLLAVVAPDAAFWQGSGRSARMTGILSHPYGFAEFIALFLLCLWVEWRNRALSHLAALAAALVATGCLWLTNTRSVIATLLVSILANIRGRGVFLLLGVVVLVLVAGALLSVPGGADQFGSAISRSGAAQRGLTLSGRVDLWSIAIERFAERPLLGHGFYNQVVYNYETLLTEDSADRGSHAHNMVLQSLVSLGLAGTILLVPMFIAQFAHLIRNRASPLSPFITFFMIVGMVSLGGLETTPSSSSLVFMLICVGGVSLHEVDTRERLRRSAASFMTRGRLGAARTLMGSSSAAQRLP